MCFKQFAPNARMAQLANNMSATHVSPVRILRVATAKNHPPIAQRKRAVKHRLSYI